MDVQAERALDAVRRGYAAFAADDLAAAQEWFERGLRYAPADGTAKLSLASVALGRGDLARAAHLFAEVARELDAEAAWLGLTAARLRLGDIAGASSSAAALLSRFATDPEGGTAKLAAQLVAAGDTPGWCAMTADGRLLLKPAKLRDRPKILFDGLESRDRAVPPGVREVRVSVRSVALLGSPIDVAAQRRVEGWVEPGDGGLHGPGLRGWAWFPGNPAMAPRLIVSATTRRLELSAGGADVVAPRALMQPRGFCVTGAELAGFTGPITVATEAGGALAGSPIDLGSEARRAAATASAAARLWPLDGPASASPLDAALAGSPVAVGLVRSPAIAPMEPGRPVVVVVPAYRGAAETAACLDALVATLPPGTLVVVVDDASPEPALAALLDARAAAGLIQLHRLPVNAGFPVAANHGLRAAAALDPRADLVLLNSDTVPAPGWLAALARAVQAAPDVGSATPLSNDGTIMSYPAADGANPMPGDTARLCAMVAGDLVVDLPTSVGFCVYLRRECLHATGVFRADAFAQGYGEENDWSLRAHNLGWRHVGVPGAFVAHVGGRSFGVARPALTARNLGVLEALHPGYRAAVAEWIFARNPLAPFRRALDLARLADAAGPATLLITHDGGGGVERYVEARAADLGVERRRALVLRPVVDVRPAELRGDADHRYRPGFWRLDIGAPADPGFPNLIFAVTEIAALAEALARLGVGRVEVHHLLGHDHDVMTLPALLELPYDVVVHDHAWFCARITTVSAGRYCGEPDIAGCAACVADHGSRLEEPVAPADLVARSAGDLAGAATVSVPCADAANRLRRHFPRLAPRIAAHEDDRTHFPPATATATATVTATGEVRVCVVGAIGVEKGFDVLLACARDAAARASGLSFHVVGHTADDDRLLDTGRVRITGPFERSEVSGLVRAQGATVGFLPSIWPETWCYALSDLWAGGLMVAAFDIGAQGERVRATGRGWLLPLGMPERAINTMLLARARPARGQNVPKTQ